MNAPPSFQVQLDLHLSTWYLDFRSGPKYLFGFSLGPYISVIYIRRIVYSTRVYAICMYMICVDLYMHLYCSALQLPPDILIIKGRGIGIVYNPNNNTTGGSRAINQNPSQHRFKLTSKTVHRSYYISQRLMQE